MFTYVAALEMFHDPAPLAGRHHHRGLVELGLAQQVLQLAILGLELTEPLRLGHLHAAIFGLPAVQRVLGHAVLADQVDHCSATFMLPEHRDDLFFGVALALHIGTFHRSKYREIPHHAWFDLQGDGQTSVYNPLM